MSFKHSFAVKTLKGKLGWLLKKCLFSVTNASDPTHSVYAAIKASASLNPFVSYFAPNSKGMRKSSSIAVKILMNLTKAWNSFGVKFALTSSTIVRHIQTECRERFSIRTCRSDSQLSFLKNPKAKIYSLASRTSRKLFLPEPFPGLTQMLDHFIFAHSCERRGSFRYAFSQLVPQFLGFCFFIFHYLTPRNQIYAQNYSLSIDYKFCVKNRYRGQQQLMEVRGLTKHAFS